MTPFSWDKCEIHHGPSDIGSWKKVTKITDCHLGNTKPTEFSFRADWIPKVTSEGPLPLVGNVWIIACIDGNWYASTWDYLKPGQTEKNEDMTSIIEDQIRLQPWIEWVPQEGEVLGLMVSTLARGTERNGNERSSIAWTRFTEGGVIGYEGDDMGGSTIDALDKLVEALESTQKTVSAILDTQEKTAELIKQLNQRIGALEHIISDDKVLRDGDTVHLESDHGTFLRADDATDAVTQAAQANAWEEWKIKRV